MYMYTYHIYIHFTYLYFYIRKTKSEDVKQLHQANKHKKSYKNKQIINVTFTLPQGTFML